MKFRFQHFAIFVFQSSLQKGEGNFLNHNPIIAIGETRMVKMEKRIHHATLFAIVISFAHISHAKAAETAPPQPLKLAKAKPISATLKYVKNKYSSDAQENKGAVSIEAKKITSNPVIGKPLLQSQSNSAKIQTNSAKIQMISHQQMQIELGGGDNEFVQKSGAPIGIAEWQKIGSPYQVNGVWYIPAAETDYSETGRLCSYGNEFQGRATANGEIFDNKIVTIAHPTLPMPGLVQITNLQNKQSIIARVNDRGPFVKNCIAGISQKGAKLLGDNSLKTAQIKIEYIGYAKPSQKNIVQKFAVNKLNPKISTQSATQGNILQASAQVPKTTAPIANNNKPNLVAQAYKNNVVASVQKVNDTRKKIDHTSILASL
jgi:rare lipoprotein A